MSTDVDWQQELDSSFGSGHDLPPGHYVAAGRTAVRRRRVAGAVALAASVAVVGGAMWAASPDPSVRGDAPVATRGAAPDRQDEQDEKAVDRSTPRSAPSMSVEEEFIGNPAVLEPGGVLKMSPLAGRVLEKRLNPMGYRPKQGYSMALRVMYEGEERYSFMSLTRDGTSLSTTTHAATGDFPGWVAGVAETERTLDEMNGVRGSGGADAADASTWLELGPRGTPVPTRPGVVATEVRADVDLGAGFAPPGATTGVMRLVVDGTSRVAAYRVIDGQLDVISGPGRFESLSAFITWARGQYASGEGMR